MGAIFSMVGSAVGSCLGAIGASCAFNCLSSIFPTGYTPAKVYSLLLFFASVITAIALIVANPQIPSYFKVDCPENSWRCFGVQSVYRVSFVDFIFFLALSIGSYISVAFHIRAWGLKVLAFTGFLLGMFFVNNHVFSGAYLHIARIASLVYLGIQVVILVNFLYSIHDGFTTKIDDAERQSDENTARFYKFGYLVLSIGSFILALAGVGMLFKVYGPMPCHLNQFFISLTLIAGIASLICSSLEVVDMGVLTPSLLFLYLVYMCWTALQSNPNPQCNPVVRHSGDGGVTASAIASIVILAISISYTCLSTYRALTGWTQEEVGTSTVVKKEETKDVEGQAGAINATSHEESVLPADAQYVWGLHLILALSGAYMGMILTNWGDVHGMAGLPQQTVGLENMWLKIVAQWLTIMLYQASLWAPYLKGETTA